MSIHLLHVEEIRNYFKADADALLLEIQDTLHRLNVQAPEGELFEPGRKASHGLRGVAASVGLPRLSQVMAAYETLFELAQTLRLSASDEMRELCTLMASKVTILQAAIVEYCEMNINRGDSMIEAALLELSERWGNYLTPVKAPDAPAPKPPSVAAPAAPAPEKIPLQPEPDLDIQGEVDREMLPYFIEEALDVAEQMEALLLKWKQQPDATEPERGIFRGVHTLKGAANSLGFTPLGSIYHDVESWLVERRDAENLRFDLQMFDVISNTGELTRRAIGAIRSGSSLRSVAPLFATIRKSLQGLVPEAPEAAPVQGEQPLAPARVSDIPQRPAADQDADTATQEVAAIRVDGQRLEQLMNLVGELLVSRSRLEAKLRQMSRLNSEFQIGQSRLISVVTEFQRKYEYSPRRVSTSVYQGFSELEFDQYDDFNMLARSLVEIGSDTNEIFNELTAFLGQVRDETDVLNANMARLQDELTRMRMVPFTPLFRRLEMATVEAGIRAGKRVSFVANGGEIRVDKLVADSIYAPLLQMIRNSVAHGIEDPRERSASGKPEEGVIRISAQVEANHVLIDVVDDGRGLDTKRIAETARARGLVAAEKALSEAELIELIFTPGFTTSPEASAVAGRGMGLDIVRQEIRKLNGRLTISHQTGKGCQFRVMLPVTLSINQVLTVSVSSQSFALPLNVIEKVHRVSPDSVFRSGTEELIRLGNEWIPIIRMAQYLGLPESRGVVGDLVIVRVENCVRALWVDRIENRRDVVVKRLDALVGSSGIFTGATLSEQGNVLFIIDVPTLVGRNHDQIRFTKTDTFQAASETVPVASLPPPPPPSTVPLAEPPTPQAPAPRTTFSILVVDDSLSVRKVIERHLLAANYEVTLANDGLDGLEKLRSGTFDFVLSDLEMPNMNGFEFISEVRRTDAFASLPIVVVTSRDAAKHRVKAVELGANDFIIKPFTSEQLCQCIERFLKKGS